MNEFAKAILDLSKACSTRRVTASGMVSSKPCFIFAISGCPTDPGVAFLAEVHNGETSSAEVLMDMATHYREARVYPYIPLYFNRGIYLALTTNVKSITIQYLEEGR